MKIKLVGLNTTSFLNNQGVRVEGTNLFYTYPTTNENGVGEECEKKFVDKNQTVITLPALKVGAFYDMEYSNKGKLLAMREAATEPKKAQ